ncbi:MAG: hypothetical protein FWH21_00370 [Kiritimatiellaeota bacterium]|nr:hypothetical protein [Kiritimatiellota bacterium]
MNTTLQVNRTGTDVKAPASTLLGLAIDVSGSMRSSIHNSQMMDVSRLGGVEKGLAALLEESHTAAKKYGDHVDLPLRVFAYAFGLQTTPPCADLLTLLRFAQGVEESPGFKVSLEAFMTRRRREAEAKGEQLRRKAEQDYGGLVNLARSYGLGGIVEDTARRLLTQEAEHLVTQEVMTYLQTHIGDTTLDIGDLVRMWGTSCNASLGNVSRFIFGNTPMRECMREIEARFMREKERAGDTVPDRILLVISDGEPTDGDPSAHIRHIQDDGIVVACVFVTDRNIQAPRELRQTAAPEWPHGARQMFGWASPIESLGQIGQTLRGALEKSGWTVPEGARLFIQANHSDTLADFMRIVGTALPIHQLARRIQP